jgi:hypothetical protein
MKPISFTIGMNAYDCYLYGGYVFFIMRDGRILYGSYPQIISRLEHKYDMFSGLIKIAFLRNDYYHSNVAKTFLRIPALKECIYKEWDRLSLQEGLFLDFEEIEDILATLCTLPSIPLDTKVYGMRLFVGCTDGMYEVRLCSDGRYLNPKKIERCFDGKVIHLNAKYGEIVLSLGLDGLVAESIDIEGDEITKVSDKKVFAQRSHRTSWANSDIMNYSTPSEFSYFRNATMERSRSGQNKFWEKYETRQIVEFATHEYPMEEMISNSGLKKEDISACFNSQDKSFIQLKDGSIVSYKFKEKEENNEANPKLSTKSISLATADSTKEFGRMLSGTTVPKGCVIEFFDKVVLIQNSMMQIVENQEVMKVRSFMNAYRFQDLLSITKQDSITLHALDTLDVSKDLRTSYRTASSIPIDLLDNIPEVLNMPYKGNYDIDDSDDSDLPL